MPDDPGGIVYGAMLVATLLAAESPGRESYGTTAGAVAVATLLYWLAAAYGEFTGERARAGEPFTLSGLRAALAHKLAVIAGGCLPLLAVLACWAASARLATAVAVAVAVAIAVILATELGLGLRAELRGRALAVQTAFGALLGVAILAIKLLLH